MENHWRWRQEMPRRALKLGSTLAENDKISNQFRTTRILIADDHNIFRDGLRCLLETQPQFVVVGDCSDGAEAVTAVARLKPDILLLDLQMPRLHGLEVLKELSALSMRVRTILVIAEIEKQQIVEALLLGASGVVMKDTSPQLLFKAISMVMEGQYWIGRESVTDIIQTLREMASSVRNEQRKHMFGLTTRELEIVSALAEGETNKDIARRLSVSEETVKHHLTNIYNKVGVSQRLELVLFALRHNLISNEPPQAPPKTLLTTLNLQ
jgi:DNA-binding NarL/FixJ family response regulator